MKKKLRGFSYYKNIANFEGFWRDKNFSKNLYFLGSDMLLFKTGTYHFFKKNSIMFCVICTTAKIQNSAR